VLMAQVRFRGYDIELGEIEGDLMRNEMAGVRCPGARAEPEQEPALVGYGCFGAKGERNRSN